MKHLITTLLLATAVSSWAQTKHNQATSGPWEVSNPDTEGIPAQVFDGIHQDIQDGKYGLIDYFMVIRNSKLVFDQSYQQDYQNPIKKIRYHQPSVQL